MSVIIKSGDQFLDGMDQYIGRTIRETRELLGGSGEITIQSGSAALVSSGGSVPRQVSETYVIQSNDTVEFGYTSGTKG